MPSARRDRTAPADDLVPVAVLNVVQPNVVFERIGPGEVIVSLALKTPDEPAGPIDRPADRSAANADTAVAPHQTAHDTKSLDHRLRASHPARASGSACTTSAG